MVLSFRLRGLFTLVTLGWICLCVAGCATRDRVEFSPSRPPAQFSEGGSESPPPKWWSTFGDAELDRQISLSMEGSFPLEAARQRILAAQALARREAADLALQVDGTIDARSAFQTNGPNVTDLGLGLNASYQVDIWGEIGSRIEAQWLRASAAEADQQVVALLLAADVASTWFSLIEAHAQAVLLEEQIRTNTTGLQLQEARFGLGQIRSADVLRQRQLVESTQQQAVIVQTRIEILEHLMAILQGVPPQNAAYSPGDQLPELPPLPSTGLPSNLLNRRPDIQRDYLALWAADRDLASAVSRQYPRLNLAASLETVTESPEDLFRDWAGSFVGQMIAPLLNGGRLRADVERNAAVVRQRFSEFSQTVLEAYREVEDALTREKYQVQQIQSLESQAELARQSSVQLREQYLIGDVEYLDVLSSITQEQSLRRQALSAKLDLVLNRISLYLALSGGFDGQVACPQLILIVPPEKNKTRDRMRIEPLPLPTPADE